ncbi:L,D-transpeptidase [Nitrosomonadales bacterium]|nr:L,D-transpeptidase [Nitrosomonadales bacterium]
MTILIKISIKNQRLTITDDKYNLLDSASRLATSKLEMNALLKTWLSLVKKDAPDDAYSLEVLEKGIQLNDESDNLNQFRQKVKQLKNHQVNKSYPVSTALKGIGQNKNSFQTPIGTHYIRAKIGEGLPALSIFEARRPTGRIWNKEDAESHPNHDWILSRILWLSGKELGVNRLGTIDTMQRYIYIHGTPDERQLGKPLSHGCIRMSNNDVIELFNLIPIGTIVNINEE